LSSLSLKFFSGQQLAFGILQRHDDGVIRDVVRRRRLQTNLLYGARERLARQGLHGELHWLALLDLVDVALTHLREDPHV
jgi:hypothetical protein